MLDLVAGARRLHHCQPVAAWLMSGLSKDFYDVAAVQLVAQRDHASVHFGAHASVAHFGVNRVSKVNGRGITWQNHNLALRGEDINLFRIEIDLERGEKLVGIRNVAL